MKTIAVKDLMVPLAEYATVSEEATLYDAVLALEKAQEAFDPKKQRHRAVLVFDKKNRIVGKLGQPDILRALGPIIPCRFQPSIPEVHARKVCPLG